MSIIGNLLLVQMMKQKSPFHVGKLRVVLARLMGQFSLEEFPKILIVGQTGEMMNGIFKNFYHI